MTDPLITCIVPAHNAERFLGDTLESILKQTYRCVEIIVVDDGSTDNTAVVVAEYDGKVRYMRQPNTGASAARNCGLAVARGELIALLDADDLWHSEKLARQSSYLRGRCDVGATFTHVQNFWIDALRDEAERFRNHRIMQPLPGYVASTMMAKRTAFGEVGVFEARLQQADVADWVLRARDKGIGVDMLPDVLTRRRIHQLNQSRVKQDESWDEYLRLLKANLDRRRRD